MPEIGRSTIRAVDVQPERSALPVAEGLGLRPPIGQPEARREVEGIGYRASQRRVVLGARDDVATARVAPRVGPRPPGIRQAAGERGIGAEPFRELVADPRVHARELAPTRDGSAGGERGDVGVHLLDRDPEVDEQVVALARMGALRPTRSLPCGADGLVEAGEERAVGMWDVDACGQGVDVDDDVKGTLPCTCEEEAAKGVVVLAVEIGRGLGAAAAMQKRPIGRDHRDLEVAGLPIRLPGIDPAEAGERGTHGMRVVDAGAMDDRQPTFGAEERPHGRDTVDEGAADLPVRRTGVRG